MKPQPENEPTLEAEPMEAEAIASGPAQVHGSSEPAISIGRSSEPSLSIARSHQSESGTEVTEPDVTESENNGGDSSAAASSIGPLLAEFLAQAEEQAASHLDETSAATEQPAIRTETTRLLEEFVQNHYPEFLMGFPTSPEARRVGRALAALGNEMEEERRPALRRRMEQLRISRTGSTATLTQTSMETLPNIGQQFSQSVRSEIDELFGSVSSFLEEFFSFAATRPATLTETSGVKYELTDTIQVQASALSSTTDSLLTLSRTGLVTEYNASSLEVTNSIHLHEGSYPLMRFTSSPFGTVIAANERLFLYGENPWSENTEEHILDVTSTNTPASTNDRGQLYVLTMSSKIRIYDLTRDTHTLSDSVSLPRNDSGRMALCGDSLYVTREGEGLVKRMDIRTHEITEVLSGLRRPTAITAFGSYFAVADDHNVNIYSSNTNEQITSIPIGTSIFDIQLIGDRIFVLTRNEIRSYKLRL